MTQGMQEPLGVRLRVLRARAGLSQEEAAKRMGVTPETLSALERGRRRAYTPTLSKIAKGYGVPVEELLEDLAPLGEAPTSGTRTSGSSSSPAEPEVKGPDPAVWGRPEDRPGPEARLPESHGEEIHIYVHDDLSTEPERVNITRAAFLEVFREVKRGEITPEEAVERVKGRESA